MAKNCDSALRKEASS